MMKPLMPREVEAGAVRRWMHGSWVLFRRHHWMWLVLAMATALLNWAIGLLPSGFILVNVLVLLMGLLVGIDFARQVDLHREFELQQYWRKLPELLRTAFPHAAVTGGALIVFVGVVAGVVLLLGLMGYGFLSLFSVDLSAQLQQSLPLQSIGNQSLTDILVDEVFSLTIMFLIPLNLLTQLSLVCNGRGSLPSGPFSFLCRRIGNAEIVISAKMEGEGVVLNEAPLTTGGLIFLGISLAGVFLPLASVVVFYGLISGFLWMAFKDIYLHQAEVQQHSTQETPIIEGAGAKL